MRDLVHAEGLLAAQRSKSVPVLAIGISYGMRKRDALLVDFSPPKTRFTSVLPSSAVE